MNFLWLLPVLAGISLLLTWQLRRYALSASLIDTPNARSSHSVPTPRGGGVAIVISFLAAVPVLAFADLIPWSWAWGMLGAGLGVAVLGFMDDHGHIAARWRLLGHFLAAVWVLFFLQGLAPLKIFGHLIDLGWLGNFLAVLYLVWLLNLYNFMDGIDGIASIEALCACLGMCVVYGVAGHAQLVWTPLVFSMAVVGFLYWNFPPARIFMGDAGSGFIGIILGAFSLQACLISPQLFWAWLIMLGVFIVDATFTLIRRLLRGDKVYEAHRSHAYQFASRQIGRHRPVTLAVACINIFWLLPVALAVVLLDLDGVLGLVVGYVPLVWLAIKFNAGSLEPANTP
ncbi:MULTISPECIES: MraY family glycosyltransferase [Pseudomonas]|jgi:Fuc2NAc and GlcNAc transferase|uniref:MraY family glycosyltransferase n=1 Tax=Pseudomonas TaxID=286 RepID=UPI0004533F7A|nr:MULTISPECIES: glycosyltransferase family 4 protein [Pseudomonas]EZP64993.1 glycosyl transferase WbpL [Pseudomonas sp. RIT357]